jgi:hypothetical protein
MGTKELLTTRPAESPGYDRTQQRKNVTIRSQNVIRKIQIRTPPANEGLIIVPAAPILADRRFHPVQPPHIADDTLANVDALLDQLLHDV